MSGAEPRTDARAPKVTIGMPVYNGARHLARALDSLLAQTFTDFELVIADNASTDRTGDICKDYAARDARIRVRAPCDQSRRRVQLEFRGRAGARPVFQVGLGQRLVRAAMLERCVQALDADRAWPWSTGAPLHR